MTQPLQYVRLVYNNDPHEKFQSMPRLVAGFNQFSRQAEAQGVDVLRLNSGDNNIGTEAYEAELTVLLNNLMRFHATTAGNHEFDLGAREFARTLEYAGAPVVVSNLEIPTKNPLADQVRKGHILNGALILQSQHGQQFGVIGVTTPELDKVLNANVRMEGLDDEDFNETVGYVRRQVEELEARGVNKIILLSHMGTDYDKALIRQVGGIDVIVSGHDHKRFDGVTPGVNYFSSVRGEPVLMLETGKNAQFFGVADLAFTPEGRVMPLQNRLVNPLQMPADPQAEALKNAYLGPPVTLATLATPYYNGNNAFSPDPIGEFTADMMRYLSGADIALVRSPEIRRDLMPGPLTQHDLKELMPFNDPVVRLALTGKEILGMLNESARCIQQGDNHPGMINPSGMRFTVNRTTGTVAGVSVLAGQRWVPIDANRKYQVAIGEFSVKNGEELADAAHPERVNWNSRMSLREVTQLGLMQAGGRPLSFRTDGRTRVV